MDEVQVADEVQVVNPDPPKHCEIQEVRYRKYKKHDQEIEVVEEEAIHRLRPIPSPQKRYVRNSQINPEIHLDRNDKIPYV